MQGKIALEEHCISPKEAAKQGPWLAGQWATDVEQYEREILDVDTIRLKHMDDGGIGITVLSHTGPAAQDVWIQKDAEKLATELNDFLAEKVKAHPTRFRAFANLSMHDPKQAASELRRCVKELGFVGALLYDTQRTGPDGFIDKFYDHEDCDPFWAEVVALDVPVYMHPRNPTTPDYAKLWEGRPYLMGPPLSFAQDTSRHVLGMVTNGVFDRFPTAKVVIGHLGEHIPFDLWRIDRWFELTYKTKGLEKTCKERILTYFRRNIWITTSGHFSTPTLKYVMEAIGKDRIMFSTDYPYESMEMACSWFDSLDISDEDKRLMGETNARKLLKL